MKPPDIARALLTGYVQFKTQAPHGAEVAGILGETTDAQRKWRQRNKKLVQLWGDQWREQA